MVDIIIGSTEPVGLPTGKPGPTGAPVEAELLHVREPRHRIVGPLGQERRRQQRQDPHNGKVLTLLIADGASLPKDLDIKKYKVLLRFMKK
ncbi:hypothetical protein Despr_0902 [Desulfobulbus propionicus DSM 2032]|jgi:hypothetical protein|uniref:Uncharacterized protein n=1 Tax=Desulfobulbus propionicus (strain ATCC 33891 / DSM 2032 / VKM B-1956 / 1pr3) TaxID=577650 RepID=A0A7U3YKJ1_DESPD|nr:hypothetical protein [Desulfobulbus propionicus]ADW17076.1 hypothetical protein Despr_0902 [Desulfobulbus propionicus DSM 2032]